MKRFSLTPKYFLATYLSAIISVLALWSCSTSDKDFDDDGAYYPDELEEAGIDEEEGEDQSDEDTPISASESVDSYESEANSVEDSGEDEDFPADEDGEDDELADDDFIEEEGEEGESDLENSDLKSRAALPSSAEIDANLAKAAEGPPGPAANPAPLYVEADEENDEGDGSEDLDEEAQELAEAPQEVKVPLAENAQASFASLTKEIYFVKASQLNLLASAGGAITGSTKIRGDRVAVLSVSGTWAQLDNGSYVDMSGLTKEIVAYRRGARGWSNP